MNTSNQSDLIRIIDGCARGDRKCQQQIFERLYGRMLSVCIRYVGDADEAKDLLQEGFIKVFDNIKMYNHQGSFDGWVRRIIVNTTIDAIRKNKQTFVRIDDDNYERLKDDNDEEISWNYTLQSEASRAMEAVSNLSPAYRTVFNLYVMEGYSHREIAEMLGISEGTSKSNLAKAKMNLRKALGQLEYYNET